MSKVIFEEKQRFNQWWIWLLVIVIGIVVFYSLFEKETIEMDDVLVPVIVFGLVAFLLFGSVLQTRIDEHGVHVKYFPFHFSIRSYSWEDIYSIEAGSYSPLAEFGGWGYRISFTGNGKAYNVRGSDGIRLVTAAGKKRLIGTQKVEEAKQVIQKYFQSK